MADEKEPTTPATPPPVEAPKGEAPKPEEGKAATPPTEAVQKAEDTFEITYHGEKIKLNREQATKYAQMGAAGQIRMAEAARKEKELETRQKELTDVFNRLDKEQGKTLRQIFIAKAGGDRRAGEKLYHDFLVQEFQPYIERAQMSPEEQRAAEARLLLEEEERKIKAREEELKAKETQILTREEEAKAAEERKAIDAELPVVSAKFGLQEVPEAEADIVARVLEAADAGIAMTLEQSAQLQAAKTVAIAKAYLKNPDALKKADPETYNAVVKHYTDSIRANGTSTPRASTPQKRDDQPAKQGRSGQKQEKNPALARIMARVGNRPADF